MTQKRIARLDRLFARGEAVNWTPRRDMWQPAWKPRGRWWMRAPDNAGYALHLPANSAWRRLARPDRAA